MSCMVIGRYFQGYVKILLSFGQITLDSLILSRLSEVIV